MKKKVLFLGASGGVGPFVIPGLQEEYDLLLADLQRHPEGLPVVNVDITSYDQVHEAARGMDAIMNFTVVRDDPEWSFHVNVQGAWHVMRAAVAHGIKKIIYTGPQYVWEAYEHDFDIADVPPAPGSGYYRCTKLLGREICRIFAQCYGIQTISFVFAGMGPRPAEPVSGRDVPIFHIFWEDLQHACRLALEIESIPGHFQELNMFSCEGHGKYRLDKARQMLGFTPTQPWEEYFRRIPGDRPGASV